MNQNPTDDTFSLKIVRAFDAAPEVVWRLHQTRGDACLVDAGDIL
jgi:hypothetical protein